MRSRILSLVLVLAMTLPLASCSKNLGPETLPSTTLPVTSETSETSETTKETEPTETEPLAPEPTSIPLVSKMPVKNYGSLHIINGKITTKSRTPIMLRGMSSSALNECPGFFGAETVKTLAEDWGVEVIRIAVPADKGKDTYIDSSEKYFKQTCDIIDLCIDQGIYVIVNWHNSADGDPNRNKKKAVEFFTRIAGIYADRPNVIYEVCNEPSGKRYGDKKKRAVDWNNTVKPFAEAVIKAIRAIDRDNIIIVGTPDSCRDIDKAAANPIKAINIAYSVHFSSSDGKELQEKIINAKKKGICIWATEWKATDASGNNAPDAKKTSDWLDFLETNKIIWCNSAIYATNTSNANALIFESERYSIEDIFAGHWPEGLISESGKIVRDRLLAAKGLKKPDTKFEPEEDDIPEPEE